jgi:hypothetical protein
LRRLLVAVLLAISTLLTPFSPPTVLAAGLPANHAQFVARVFERINAERQRVGLPPLTPNGSLTRAAQGYATVLADGSCFGHECGSTIVGRANQAGYAGTFVGENIAGGQSTPDDAMGAWMASAGHRGNILGAGYRDVGVGVAAQSGGRLFWVQTFGTNATSGAPVPPPADCSTRPAANVRATATGPGVLQVIVTAGRPGGAPHNALRAIQFGSAANGAIDIPGYGSAASNTNVGVAPGTEQLTFVVRRAANGAAAMVPFVLTDACGSWPTFVGGGPTAF